MLRVNVLFELRFTLGTFYNSYREEVFIFHTHEGLSAYRADYAQGFCISGQL